LSVAYKNGDDKRALHARAEKVAGGVGEEDSGLGQLVWSGQNRGNERGCRQRDGSQHGRSVAGGQRRELGFGSGVARGAPSCPGTAGTSITSPSIFRLTGCFSRPRITAPSKCSICTPVSIFAASKVSRPPHSIFPIPQTHRLLITDGSESIKLLDAGTLASVGTIKLHPGADSIGFDSSTGHLYVVTGGKDVKLKESWLEEIDPVTTHKLGEVPPGRRSRRGHGR